MENNGFENNQNQISDFWQAEVLGQIYDTDFFEMTQWISEGALTPSDKVRRGNLRWLEAGKVPTLVPFFNAKQLGVEPPAVHARVTDAAETNAGQIPPDSFIPTENFAGSDDALNANFQQLNEPMEFDESDKRLIHASKSEFENSCILHPENEAEFHCETCANIFCRECPKSYGGSVKTCPMCGALCKKIGEIDRKKERENQFIKAAEEGFGVADITKAFAYPLRYKASLLFGGLMFMVFTLGQSAGALGGIFMIFAALFCFMLANMLAFGILANTIENFSQGKLNTDFMPKFDDFNLWDDIIHPFFLSIGVYVSSFGAFILIVFIGVYLVIGSMTAKMQKMQTEAAQMQNSQAASPYLVDEKKAFDQSEEVKKILADVKQKADERRALSEKNVIEAEESITQTQSISQTVTNEEQSDQLNKMIQDSQKRELESMIGKTEETKNQESAMMLGEIVKLGVPLLIVGFAALIWGIFYFPAACAVAGYTRSFWATINPLVGIDTIKTFGIDYLKIFGVYILILFSAAFVGGIIAVLLSPFALPKMGNLPATAITSWITFYLTIVFSCVLGLALFKNSDKFKFYRG